MPQAIIPFAIPFFRLLKQGIFQARQPRPAAQAYSVVNYNEFYCQANGSNLNSGHDNQQNAKYTTTNGNWSTTTNVFIPTDNSNPVSSGVAVGDWVSIYIDGATVGVYIALVTAVVNATNGAITVSSTQNGGTPPTTSATTRTLKCGGAWLGSQGSVLWPFQSSFSFTTLKNPSTNWTRVNLKNDQTYSITNGLSVVGTGLVVQGYTSNIGDGGRATIDGGTTNIVILTPASQQWYVDLIFTSSATAGTNSVISTGGQNHLFLRVTVIGARGTGFNIANNYNTLLECEAFNCNKSGTSGAAGFVLTSNSCAIRCISAGNLGSNSDGFGLVAASADVTFIGCVSFNNSRHGFNLGTAANKAQLFNCDMYNNGGHGLINGNTITTLLTIIENCNFIKNKGAAISAILTTGRWQGLVLNCGVGNGSAANLGGKFVNTDQLQIINVTDYPADQTPWVSPDTGNFSIILPAALSAGRGNFTETQGGFSGTVGYPDIGAAQAQITTVSWGNIGENLPLGYINHVYAVTWVLTFIGNPVITLQSGTLPPGISLVNNVLSGTPTTLGTYIFVLRLTVGGSTGDATYSITINDDPDEGVGAVGGG